MTTGLSGAFVRGALWSIVLRWSLRLIGMLSTLVVARLLTPADYGIVAMATLVMGLVETFLDADATTALLRSPNTDPSFANTAWTLKFLQSLVIALVVGLAAPFAAVYFEEPRLAPVLWTYCIVIVGSGLSSVGPLLARRQLDFYMEVKVALLGRLVVFVVTLALALWWRDYRALIAGAIAGMLAGLVIGYAMHPFRPAPTLSHAREMFGFSQWMLLSGIGLYFARKLDGFVVGRVGTTRDLGVYNLALELGQMITMELGAPLNRALLPVMSTLHGDPARMQATLMKTVAAVNTATLPAGVGLAVVAPLAVPTLLGAQWVAAVPFLALFSLIGAIRFVTGPYYTMLLTLGHSRLLAIMSWIELAFFALAILWFSGEGVKGIAEARVASTIVIGIGWVAIGTRYGLTVANLGRAVVRPLVGSVVMALVLLALPRTGLPDLLELLFQIAIGVLVYAAWIMGTWILVGRPDGIESLALAKCRSLFVRKVVSPGP